MGTPWGDLVVSVVFAIAWQILIRQIRANKGVAGKFVQIKGLWVNGESPGFCRGFFLDL
jgi:hypothetical protein